MENTLKEKILDKISERIKLLSKKSKHYVVNLGSTEKPKEEKVYHKAGKGKRWCSDCERIKELLKLRKEIELME